MFGFISKKKVKDKIDKRIAEIDRLSNHFELNEIGAARYAKNNLNGLKKDLE